MVAVVELSAGPGTTAAYARAALGLIPGFTRSGGALPDVEVRRRDVTVDRSHLAAYDRVCGFRLTDTLPPTYPHVLAFPLAMRLMTAPDFPLPLIGLVHIANRITVHRPIPSGAALDLSVRATALGDHPRGRRFDILATAALDGTEVWRGLSTYLRLAPPQPAPAPDTTPDTAQAPETTGEDSPNGSRSLPSAAAGPGTAGPGAAGPGAAGPGAAGPGAAGPGAAASSAGSEWRVPARVGTDYAAVSGDRNPIHTSRLGARLFGFPRPIAHGMWTKAHALAALEGRLPDAYTVDVTFRKPLLLPARATFTTVSTPDGWSFALASSHPHLTGIVTGPT
ncbi:acyl dehydratase [Actinoplanes xinjiangensis]|uniref:Acyl dehydratase n=3 Tax=Actinoplanes xinjiangensis TaxID=512350 RepID=A0A316FV90_9ACTN|nr:MaoC/PaaZ C-terminal domain-containing protein [Actinoplanes xinjiangensis]PWK52641.1 acyl dehydratase [Actinoplanes xinjiangensis]